MASRMARVWKSYSSLLSVTSCLRGPLLPRNLLWSAQCIRAYSYQSLRRINLEEERDSRGGSDRIPGSSRAGKEPYNKKTKTSLKEERRNLQDKSRSSSIPDSSWTVKKTMSLKEERRNLQDKSRSDKIPDSSWTAKKAEPKKPYARKIKMEEERKILKEQRERDKNRNKKPKPTELQSSTASSSSSSSDYATSNKKHKSLPSTQKSAETTPASSHAPKKSNYKEGEISPELLAAAINERRIKVEEKIEREKNEKKKPAKMTTTATNASPPITMKAKLRGETRDGEYHRDEQEEVLKYEGIMSPDDDIIIQEEGIMEEEQKGLKCHEEDRGEAMIIGRHDLEKRGSMRYHKLYKAEQNQLVSYIKDKLPPCTDFSLIQNAHVAPSLIGITTGDIDKRIEALSSVGFTNIEIAHLILSLPFIINVDWEALHRVCRGLEGYHIQWKDLLQGHLNVLLQGPASLDVRESNLKVLAGLGLDNKMLLDLLANYPLLVVSSLNDATIKTLSEAKSLGFSAQWIMSSLKDAIDHRPVGVPVSLVSPDTSNLIEFLKKFYIGFEVIMKQWPRFFVVANTSHLHIVIRVLSGKPLHLDSFRIAQIVMNYPQDVAAVTDSNALMEEMKVFADLVPSHLIQSYFLKVPLIISPEHSVTDRVNLLLGMGFSKVEVSQMVTASPLILVHKTDELKQRMSILLSLGGSSPSAIASASQESACFLSMRFKNFMSCYNYVKKHREASLHIKLFDKEIAGLHHNSWQYRPKAKSFDGPLRPSQTSHSKKKTKRESSLSQHKRMRLQSSQEENDK